MKKLSFRNRVFLYFAGLITLAILVIIFAVSVQIRSKMKQVLVHDLHGVQSVLREYQKARLELLYTKALILSEEPRLKAAIDTGDSVTVAREAGKYLPIAETDFLLVTDNNGKILSQLGNFELNHFAIRNITSIQSALQLERSKMSFFNQQNLMYQIISNPVYILNPLGNAVLLGTISIGFRIDKKLLSGLQDLTETHIVFVQKENEKQPLLIFSSFKSPHQDQALGKVDFTNLEQSDKVEEINVGREKYLVLATPFAPGSSDHILFLVKSLDEALHPILRPTLQLLLFVGAISLILTMLFSFLLSKGITSPLTKLSTAIQQVSEGNLDNPINVDGHDEIGKLARSFDDMRISLKNNIANLEKTYERLLVSEKLAATGKLFAHLSHELNNPIHNIQSALESAQRKLPAGTPMEFIKIAREEMKRLEKLVRQTLSFYRPGAQEKTLVQINDIIKELISVSKENLGRQNISIETKLAPDLTQVIANPDQLKQVFLNIILNAQDAMSGGGQLTISTVNQNDHIQIDFQDTGSGIHPEHMDKIFDAFFTTKPQVSGVGLGLSVSYEIMQRHGGDISVESQPGKGALFRIKLPRSE